MDDPPVSERSLIRSIEANPLDVRAYCALAHAYCASSAFRKAELTFRRAIEIDPFCLDAWIGLGGVHKDLADWASSADAFARACDLDGSDISAWFGYGTALLASQDVARATEVRDRLLGEFPAKSEGFLLAGHVARVSGRISEAVGYYRRVLEIDPRQTDAIFNLADVAPMDPNDPWAGTAERLTSEPELASGELANLHFALARVYDHAGDTERAFQHLHKANAATQLLNQRLGRGYAPKKMEQDVDALIELFPRVTVLQRIPPLDLDIKPIFIVGLPRSGTTLVERILSRHPDVQMGGERAFMADCLFRLRRALLDMGKRGPLRTDDARERQLLEQLREFYLDRLFESDLDGHCVTDKLPGNVFALGLIRILFPNAIIVCCDRDPVAVCWSLYCANLGAQLPYHTSFDDLAHYHLRVYSRVMRHWDAVLGDELTHVSYERLVTSPQIEIRRLLSRCGLPPHADCFEVVNSSDVGSPIFTASMQEARNPVHANSLVRWRAYEAHIEPLITALRDARPC
jgi:tetratricopeptide (TPR) repeat protein